MRAAAWSALFVLLIIGGIAFEVAVWRECMADHPWWFCLRVLSK